MTAFYMIYRNVSPTTTRILIPSFSHTVETVRFIYLHDLQKQVYATKV